MALLSLLLAIPALSAAQTAPPEVPFKVGDDAIIVNARVNGANVSLMFDTGFGGSVVLDDTIEVGKPSGKMTLRDFVGELEVNTVKMRSLSLGSAKIDPTDMEIVQQPSENYSAAYGTHCDGIMGFSVIKNNITEINFEKKKFIFYPKSFDISKRVPDNKRTFLAKLLPIGNNSMEMAVVTPSGKTMTMALDTGNAFYATTHRDVLERVGLWDGDRTPKFIKLSGVASGAVDSWSRKMPPLTIFGVPVKNTVWDIIDRPSSSAEGDGTIGFGFLSNFNITIDYERRRVWLENWKQPIEGDEKGDLGISAYWDPKNKRAIAVFIAPDSPAEKAGVKKGDTILSIDGLDLVDMTHRRLAKVLQGPVGSTVELATSRNGGLRRLKIVRQALVNE